MSETTTPLTPEEKKKIISAMLEKGMLLSPDMFSDVNVNFFLDTKGMDKASFPAVFNPMAAEIIAAESNDRKSDQNTQAEWNELEKLKVKDEKNKSNKYAERINVIIEKRTKLANEKNNIKEADRAIEADDKAKTREKNKIKILFNYMQGTKKKDIQDFVKYYNARYKALEKLLSGRQELNGLTSIARVLNKKERDNISIIGIVKEKSITSNNNVMLVLEDPSGEIKVAVNKTKQEIYDIAKDIVVDEVIGLSGSTGNKIIFCSNIIVPDIPVQKELKKAPEEYYALFLSDIHVGSNTFLPEEFNRFLKWLNGEMGSEAQRGIVKKIRYIFIAGDLVDGVGIYPGQESELVIKDIYEQYRVCAEYLSKIPEHIQIIVSPGNHDASRLSEPQPPLSRDFIRPLLDLPNLHMMSNPCMVNIGETDSFPGFDVLLYHGYSFDYFIAEVDTIRNSGGYDRADLIMKFLLQRRHLAPSHDSTLHEPDTEFDPLVISRVPDFFISGHIHKVAVSSYRGVSTICGSCWQSTTSFQEKMGHHPEPARVPIVNLQTRETKIMRF